MLNRRERYKVLQLIRIASNLGPLPLQVNLASRDLKPAWKRKQWICTISYSFFLLHTLYKVCGLAHAYLFDSNVQLHHMVIHAIMASGSVVLAFWYYMVHVLRPGLFATFVKMTLVGNIGGPPMDLSDRLNKHWRRRLREYSLQDLIALSLPYMILVGMAFITSTYVYDPSMTVLLYAALPTQLQNWDSFGLCLMEEIRFLWILATIAVPIWVLQVVSCELISSQLKRTMKAIQDGTKSGRSIYRYLRCLQLYTRTFNSLNSYLIFTWKLDCISICILSGYAAIAHFREHPIFGCMYYAILLDAGFVYAVIYQKAFKIPQLFHQTAARALLHVRGNRMERNDVFKRQIKSIPPTGIKVGQFHTMERASTLIFMDFVLANVVNMLVAYG